MRTWVEFNSQFRCIRTAYSWRIYNTTPWILWIIKFIELCRGWHFINEHFQEHQKYVEHFLCAFNSVRNCFTSHWGTWSSPLHYEIWNLVLHLIESLWYKSSVGFFKSSARLSRFIFLECAHFYALNFFKLSISLVLSLSQHNQHMKLFLTRKGYWLQATCS